MRRRKIRLKYKKERVLLSDVLPYELPFIFTNRYFYRFLVKNEIEIKDDRLYWKDSIEEGAKLILACIFRKEATKMESGKINVSRKELKTIPFTYSVIHKPTQHRQLSIVHPANQIKIVDFYDKYKNVILYLCSKSRYSIRFPHKVACYFYYKDRLHRTLIGKKADKIELFFSEYKNLKTFFSYKRYTNIYKFYEDYRYQRAEKKFERLMKFDLQSCFDSIYTHSLSWAINGGRDAYKDHFSGSPDNSLGEKWDELMQGMNYNETNGILIGPEFSRLFAEVILQHIDQRVEKELKNKGYKLNVDYECYRYVDDYFFFYNSNKVKDDAQELFINALKEFKLNISTEKTKFYERPFVTEITKAKIAIDSLVNESFQIYSKEDDKKQMEEEEETEADIQGEHEVESIVEEVDREKVEKSLSTTFYFKFHSTDFCKKFKTILSTNDVEAKDIMNYTLVRIGGLIERILRKYNKVYKTLRIVLHTGDYKEMEQDIAKKANKMEQILSQFLFEAIDGIFFLYAMNKRINTTLKVLQILDTIIIYLDHDYIISKNKVENEKVKRFTEYIREIVFKKICDEISLILQTAPLDENVQLETMYFLILLRQLNKKYQIGASAIEKYLKITYGNNGKQFPSLNAISIINLLYYFGFRLEFDDLKAQLVENTINKLAAIPENRRKISAEYIILALDLAACPYIQKSDRIKILQKVGLSRSEGRNVVEYMKHQKFMFTRWTGVNVTKELNAKIGQEVYS